MGEGLHLSTVCLASLANIYVHGDLQLYAQLKPQTEIPEVHFADCRQLGAFLFPFPLLTFAYRAPLSHHFHLHSHPPGCTPHDDKCSDCCHTGNGMVSHKQHLLEHKMKKQESTLRVEHKGQYLKTLLLPAPGLGLLGSPLIGLLV